MYRKRGDETNFGAIDGVVAVLFKSSIGPLGKATVLPASEGIKIPLVLEAPQMH